ncbi:hypothetical protein NSQ55_21345 [Paenibacillus sp. FSL H7-0943]|uniref:hypothetical protein n=1 Tax=Paenibacillus sp. FSL H7-0943 TaxID=2954739 RepID=UPI0030CE2C61
MAIGLQFVCETYGVEFKELAIKMETSPQNINAWLREKRNIPPKRLDQLTLIFPKIPRELFGKTLQKSEQLLIQEIFFTETDEVEVVEIPDTDDNGYEYTRTHVVSQHEGIIGHIRDEYERQLLLERYERVIDDNGGGFFSENNLIERFINLLENGENQQIELVKMLFHYFQINNDEWGFGSDPHFNASKKEMYEEFGGFLRKYKII